MNISLRQANALQHNIVELLEKIELNLVVDISEFENVTSTLQSANDLVFTKDMRRQKLLLAVYNIRGLVGTANSSSGIDIALTKAAFLEKRISQLNSLSGATPMKPIEMIHGQIEKLKNYKETSRTIFGHSEGIITGVLSQSQIDQARIEILNLKKQKQKLNDEVLNLNVKTEIPLSEEVVSILTQENIL
jgi:hypothetical protein